jgi:polyvinyl alcohol dehydrogenase (cytochrome)
MPTRSLGALALLLGAVLPRSPAALADLTCGRLCRAPVAECRTSCTQPTRTAERRCQRDCRDGMVATCKRQMPPRSACLPPDRWQMLGHDLGSNFENLAARTLSPANVGGLELDWRFQARGTVNGAPAVVDGIAYVLSAGSFYALDLATRTVRWENLDVSGSSSPTWDDGTLFVQTASGDLVAVDAATGVKRWRSEIDPRAVGWGSPIVFERYVIVGSAGADLPAYFDFRGGMVAFDRETGAELWRFYTAAPPQNGVSVWSTPSVDGALRLVYGTTGNNFSGDAGPTSDSIFALDVDTGAVRWMTQLTADDVFSIGGAAGPDFDFGTNPVLFDATIDGKRRKLLAAGQKSGALWALDRVTGAVVWGQPVSPGSSLNGGVFNNGAYDGERLLIAGNNGSSTGPGSEPTVPPNMGRARLAAIDPASGAILWERQVGGWVWAPITIANGVGYVAVDTTLEAFDVRSGGRLFTFPASGTITSAPVVAGGRVHFGAGLSYFVGTPSRDFYVLTLDGRCGGGGGGGGGTTFSAIYDDVIVGSGCTTASCHGPAPGRGGLSMSTRAEAYANLVNVPAMGGACAPAGLDRVAPGNPDQSLLYLKVARTPPCGGPMPPATALTDDAVARIRMWVAAGAPND